MRSVPWAMAGLVLGVVLWHVGVQSLQARIPIADAFGPQAAALAAWHLIEQRSLWPHLVLSLQRVAVGLGLALLFGVPLGLAMGMSRVFAQATTPLFQFLRMVSPLSWMPLAVMVLGVGDAPVYFLLAFAAVWPILLNTASGVAQLDPNWLALSRSLSATWWERVTRLVLPGITAHILTGVRLAIGLIWIVIVPAEMLGVSAGLGYFVLDTRDRLAYDELMAVIVIIGLLGYLLDHGARWLHNTWLHRR